MIYFENILICIAVPLAVMLPFMPPKAKRLFMGFILGMVMCLFGAYLNSFFSVVCKMDTAETAKYISPIVEEVMKMLPVMLYLVLFTPDEHDLLGFAVTLSAGFATFENCCYITENGSELFHFVLFRGLAVGVMHVVCGIAIGLGASLIGRYKTLMLPGTIGVFSFAMTIHALYNLLVSVPGMPTYIGFCTPIGMLLVIYFTWSARMERQEE